MSVVKEPWELAIMRQSGQRLAEVARILREAIRPGISTLDLDAVAEKEMRARNAIPSFLGYKVGKVTFHHAICACPNDVVVHGIPDGNPLVPGDVLSLDIGHAYGGYHTDLAFTVVVGQEPRPEVKKLLESTERALWLGIDQALVNQRMGDVGAAVQKNVEKNGFSVVRDFVGHGIGRALHERPSVPNYGKAGRGDLLKEGMVLAIEPMVIMSRNHATKVLKDGWTVVSADGSLAAHFEHTVAITRKGPEVLTRVEGVFP